MAFFWEDYPDMQELDGNRFLTFNIAVRVNQIEAGRDQDLGVDETAFHTPEAVRKLRDAFERGMPGGKVTWALSHQAFEDPRDNYKAIREIILDYRDRFGDDVTLFLGGFFPNMYNSREQVNVDIHDGLAMASAMVGGGFRPESIVAGFLAAENQRYLAEEEGVHVCQGNIWSQYAVDNGDGEGAIQYPYFPSREHFCKPAQGPADFIDCVNLDGWTCDFVSARRSGCTDHYNSRMGVGPIETFYQDRFFPPEVGLREMLATTAAHFDTGFSLNGFAWVTVLWETSLTLSGGDRTEYLVAWLEEMRRRWPEVVSATQGEFGLAWRRHFADNGPIDYRFVQRGTGIFGSEENLEVRWFMNRDFRLALMRDWQAGGPEEIFDFTRYDLPAEEPQDLSRNWSLMNRINQKGTRPQDVPTPMSALDDDDRALILRRYPELEGIG